MLSATKLSDLTRLREELLDQVDNAVTVESLSSVMDSLCPLDEIKHFVRECITKADACTLRRSYLKSAPLDRVLPSAILCYALSFLDTRSMSNIMCVSKGIQSVIQEFPALVFGRYYCMMIHDNPDTNNINQNPSSLIQRSRNQGIYYSLELKDSLQILDFLKPYPLIRTDHRKGLIISAPNKDLLKLLKLTHIRGFGGSNHNPFGSSSSFSSSSLAMSQGGTNSALKMNEKEKTRYLMKNGFRKNPLNFTLGMSDGIDSDDPLKGTSIPWKSVQRWHICSTGMSSGIHIRQQSGSQWSFNTDGLKDLTVKVVTFGARLRTGYKRLGYLYHSCEPSQWSIASDDDDDEDDADNDDDSSMLISTKMMSSMEEMKDFRWECEPTGFQFRCDFEYDGITQMEDSKLMDIDDDCDIDDSGGVSVFSWMWNESLLIKLNKEHPSEDDDDHHHGFGFHENRPPLMYQSTWLQDWLNERVRFESKLRSCFDNRSNHRRNQVSVLSENILEKCLYIPPGKESLMDPFRDVMFTEDTEESTAVTASSVEYSALVTVSWDSSVYSVGWALDGLRSLRMWHDPNEQEFLNRELRGMGNSTVVYYDHSAFLNPLKYHEWFMKMSQKFEQWKSEEMLPNGLNEISEMITKAGHKNIRSLVIQDPPPNFRVMNHWSLPFYNLRHLKIVGILIDDLSLWMDYHRFPSLMAIEFQMTQSQTSFPLEFFCSAIERIKNIKWKPDLNLEVLKRAEKDEWIDVISKVLNNFSFDKKIIDSSSSSMNNNIKMMGFTPDNFGFRNNHGFAQIGMLSAPKIKVWTIPETVECLHLSSVPKHAELDLSHCEHFVILEIAGMSDSSIENMFSTLKWNKHVQIECLMTDSVMLAKKLGFQKTTSIEKKRDRSLGRSSFGFVNNNINEMKSDDKPRVSSQSKRNLDLLLKRTKSCLYQRWIIKDQSCYHSSSSVMFDDDQGPIIEDDRNGDISKMNDRFVFDPSEQKMADSMIIDEMMHDDKSPDLSECLLSDQIQLWYPQECSDNNNHNNMMDECIMSKDQRRMIGRMTSSQIQLKYPSLCSTMMKLLMKKMLERKYYEISDGKIDKLEQVWMEYQSLFELKSPHWLFHTTDMMTLLDK